MLLTTPELRGTGEQGIPDYKAYEALFLSPELTRRYETFVEQWDGLDAFDDHIRMQAPTLSNWCAWREPAWAKPFARASRSKLYGTRYLAGAEALVWRRLWQEGRASISDGLGGRDG